MTALPQNQVIRGAVQDSQYVREDLQHVREDTAYVHKLRSAAAQDSRHVREDSRPVRKPRSAAARMRKTARMHRWLRFAIQIVFFLLAPALFSGAFGGVKYIFAQIGIIQGIEATSFVMLFVAVIAFTVLCGRFFCGYACAFGTLGDVLFAVFDFVRSKTPIPRIRFPEKLVRVLSLLKYVVLVAICAACVVGVWSAASGYSPWVAFASVLSGGGEVASSIALALLIVLMVGMIVRERFFCQFLCPLGAIFSLLPVLGFSEFTRMKDHCAHHCGRCHDVCPVDIWPDADASVHGECIACGRCADVCPMNNVNLVAVEKYDAMQQRVAQELAAAAETQALAGHEKQAPRPLKKAKESWHLLRGTGAGIVLAKAAVLLAVCWVVGATRYLPSFSDVFGSLPFG